MSDVVLFNRSIRVVVDTLEITGLDMLFKVNKTLKPEPNTAELRIYNLTEDHRSTLAETPTARVLIEAGYLSGASVLFLGDLRTARSVAEGPTWVTSLSSGDGEKAIQTATVNASMGKYTTPDQVLRVVCDALGVDPGNTDQAITTLKNTGINNHFAEGVVLSGSAYRQMNAICRSVGRTWSIQDGKLQILPLRQALQGSAVLLTPSTGLIGSPTVDNKGLMSCRMLMVPDVFPGRALVLESKGLKGQYRIEACTYTGDTRGQDWYIDVQAKRY